ncbi:MAG: hypothetical protein NXH95_09790 [Pseudomonadaceae bacterium]|nr:hypothetical protein [Pseudomonadaceae bacterium]
MNERIYQTDDGQWYYRARGHQDAGPFPNEEAAATALRKQVSSWRGHRTSRKTSPGNLTTPRFFRRSATRHP